MTEGHYARQCHKQYGNSYKGQMAIGRLEASPLILKGICDNEDLGVLGQQGPGTEGGRPARLCDTWQPLSALEPLPLRVHQGHNCYGHTEDAAQLHADHTIPMSFSAHNC